jgi:glycosyltransferase involved in cell wall biosynthesis
LIYLGLERALMGRTDLFLFESAYGRDTFFTRVGMPHAPVRVVHNGVSADEFAPVDPAPDVADLVFIGELRVLKGVDLLLDAVALLHREGKPVSAVVVGGGPDGERFRAQAGQLGLTGSIRFTGPLPARQAFALGRLLVVPSRAESLPYVVLEAGAAGLPMVATAVGGIPEIFGADAGVLAPPGNAASLADTIRRQLADPRGINVAAARLQTRIRDHFSVETMTEQVLAGYDEAIRRKRTILASS